MDETKWKGQLKCRDLWGDLWGAGVKSHWKHNPGGNRSTFTARGCDDKTLASVLLASSTGCTAHYTHNTRVTEMLRRYWDFTGRYPSRHTRQQANHHHLEGVCCSTFSCRILQRLESINSARSEVLKLDCLQSSWALLRSFLRPRVIFHSDRGFANMH